ncbi:MAG: ribulose-phosphate 3-epimerase [Bacteroidales bacterium]|jgi:ribulose-phosphate 3-epimerase|nr:ribulose-phosphate 3-epimerase [Bacteroidales bacterium]
MPLIAPSILSADFLHLEKDVDFVNKNADIFHLDIMDGVFVPNISFGFPVVEAIASEAKKPMDAHLMIIHPEKYVERFAKTGVGMLSFHYEAAGEYSLSVIKQIKETGMKAGMAINPDIEVEKIFPFLKDLDYVLIMSVFAGYGGQKFIETSYQRIRVVKNEISRLGLDCMIEVDGGVSPANAKKLSEAGADIFVAGSSVFGSSNPENSIRMMR